MNDKEYQQLHTQIQDLLAGYVDGMLKEDETRIVEAHLAGCQSCRMDVARQQALSQKLNKLPVPRMSAELHQRLDTALNDAFKQEESTLDKLKNKIHLSLSNGYHWIRKHPTSIIATSSGWGIAIVLFIMLIAPKTHFLSNPKHIPMVQNVIAEYQTFNQLALPVSHTDSNIKPPILWRGARVIGTWKTTIGGAPAQAFAIRNGHFIIFQFKIQESVFFHNPEVRASVAKTGQYKVKQQNLEILALPLKKSGVLIIGPQKGIPSTQQIL